MTKQPRILFIQTQAENAGAQEISRLLGEGLESRDYDVHHLFFYRKTEAFDHAPNTVFCASERPGSALGFAKFLITLVQQIRQIKPDLVLTFQHYGNLFGAPAARLAGVPYVIANQVSAQATMNDTIRRIDQIFGSLGMFNKITVNSMDTAGEYGHFPKAYTKRIVHVPHGFKDKSSRLSKPKARAMFGLPLDKPILGSVARLNHLKRLDVAIDCLKADPDWHLALGGQGPEEANLRAQAQDLGVADRVHFIGEMEPDDVGQLLAALDIFLFPSEAETFGLAAVEAAQAGLPIVANDIPVMREVLQTGGKPCALFATSADSASFARSAEHLLNHPQEAEELVKAASGLKELYSLDAMVGRYDDLIREHLQSGLQKLEQQPA
ncbi:MAG: glycosyltransferase family 4 protein [Cohaesibacter sp.]|jgi:glycosyltransferase involved in cell wall biosynthesis|nr:glycosyltransferase family 4 protein [Cohaesibacter sp.]